jgi:hypothetical protein
MTGFNSIDLLNKPDAALRDILRSGEDIAPVANAVERYLDRGEVDPSLVTDDVASLKRSMWRYVLNRGVKIDPMAEKGAYDEIMFAAYDHALRARAGRDDPLDAARSKDGSAGDSDWDFSVETFDVVEDQGVLPESVRAAGAIDYIYELGERMGIFQLAEHLVVAWTRGALDVGPEASGKLYRYWKLLDERSAAEERQLLYRRVLGKGSGQMLSRMTANEVFPGLWRNLMEEIASYIDKSESTDTGRSIKSPVSAAPIYQTIKELQYNLTEYCTGIAFLQTRELYAQLQEAFALLQDPDVIAHYSSPRRRSMFTVIERLAKEEMGVSLPIKPLLRLAVDGNKIFNLCSNFTEGAFTYPSLTELIDAGEAYIINSSIVGDASAERDNGFEGEFEDDFADDDGFGEDFDDF